MMFEIHNTRFLKASDLVFELQVLQQFKAGGFSDGPSFPNHRLARADLAACLERLKAGAMLVGEGRPGEAVALTKEGERRMRVLLVDYVRELMRLYSEVIVVFQNKLAEYYMDGVRRVAFYPMSDTAEVVYAALQGSGLTLVAVADDDPTLWGAAFHNITVQPPSTLAAAGVEGVICTTAIFEQQIREKVAVLPNLHARLLTLW